MLTVPCGSDLEIHEHEHGKHKSLQKADEELKEHDDQRQE